MAGDVERSIGKAGFCVVESAGAEEMLWGQNYRIRHQPLGLLGEAAEEGDRAE